MIPDVLKETKRVLCDSGRLGVVSMSETPDGGEDSFMDKTCQWMHRHFPHIVDCQPIAAARMLQEAGFTLTHREYVEIWSMPVAVLVGTVAGKASIDRESADRKTPVQLPSVIDGAVREPGREIELQSLLRFADLCSSMPLSDPALQSNIESR